MKTQSQIDQIAVTEFDIDVLAELAAGDVERGVALAKVVVPEIKAQAQYPQFTTDGDETA